MSQARLEHAANRHSVQVTQRMARPSVDLVAAGAAYLDIRNRILSLQYQPGAKLSEAQLCAELGLGRSPIRTALGRLKEEGWVTVVPQSGTYVRTLTPKDIEDVIELRLLLETHVAGLAAQRMEPAALRSLKMALVLLGPQVVRGSHPQYLELDEKIHSAIYKAAGNELAAELLENLRDKVRWVFPSKATALQRRQALRELQGIVDALESRDPQAAAERMRAHIAGAAAFHQTITNASPRQKPAGAPALKAAAGGCAIRRRSLKPDLRAGRLR